MLEQFLRVCVHPRPNGLTGPGRVALDILWTEIMPAAAPLPSGQAGLNPLSLCPPDCPRRTSAPHTRLLLMYVLRTAHHTCVFYITAGRAAGHLHCPQFKYDIICRTWYEGEARV